MTGVTSPTPKTICIVDDDASVLKAVGRLLTSAGWVVHGAAAFFLKPFDDEEFLGAVRSALASKAGHGTKV